jgi:hypothetical protein
MKVRALMVAPVLLFAVFLSLVGAWSGFGQDDETSFLYGFLEGRYQVIGRYPDSKETYAGKVLLKKDGGSLKVVREIGDEVAEGLGRIEASAADGTKVLRVRFVRSGSEYEATYVIASDLDNYARLTGYVYLLGGLTKQAGLEAVFVDPSASDGEAIHTNKPGSDQPAGAAP